MIKFMNEKVLKILEFHKVSDMLVLLADSAPGKEMARRIHPSADLTEIESGLQQTEDAQLRILRSDAVSFAGNSSMQEIVRALEVGAVLSIAELLQIADQLECAGRLIIFGASSIGNAVETAVVASSARNTDAADTNKEKEQAETDSLTPLFEQLDCVPDLRRVLRKCIEGPDQISDEASARLGEIRRNIRATNDRIKEKMNALVNGSIRNYLMEPVVTMRDGHYCLPVKAEYKSQVPGVIYDQSSTGSTFFIEPASVTEMFSKIRALEAEEKEEIEAIIRNLSEQAAPYARTYKNNEKMLTRLDFIFAKGQLAIQMRASKPSMNTQRIIDIHKGRHPLLDPGRVVPIDVRIGEDFNLLIVTGPNTGGKTVSLKSVGLLTLMAQAGLHIPAAQGSRIAVFKDVYADIGDEQSIEQSLSTFSAHMTNIVSILRNADANSLCLFDELCSGTDPTEGAALAISILSFLHKKQIRTMATTHYSELKLFALSEKGVENACCEFDVASLSPTYRLLIGIPGKSNAFAISKKLGLSESIIQDARTHITKDSESFEDVLAGLEQSRMTMEKDKLTMDQYKRESQSIKDQLKAKQEKLDESRDRILREAHEEARKILQDAKDMADASIREMQGLRDVKELEKTRRKLGEAVKGKNEKLSLSGAKASKESEEIKGVAANQLKIGMNVRIVSMGLKGSVSTLPDQRGNLFVTCGIMRTQTNIRDLVILPDDDTASQYSAKGGKGKSLKASIGYSKSMSVRPEIQLLGLTVDEALAKLDKYLDDAYLAHLPSVRVVHGKGTGALRNAIHSHLRGLSIVDSYRLGEFGEGDAGVTIVTFR